MRRGETRESSRSERIIHKRESGWQPKQAAHLPRSRAKIRHVDEDTSPAALLALEESVRHGHSAAAGHDFGLDIAEASTAWAEHREEKVAAAVAVQVAATAASKAKQPAFVAGAAKKGGAQHFAFSLKVKDIPKPLRHLLAGAFSGGTLPRSRWPGCVTGGDRNTRDRGRNTRESEKTSI